MTVGNSKECSDTLVCVVIGSWKSNVIGSDHGVKVVRIPLDSRLGNKNFDFLYFISNEHVYYLFLMP